MSILFTHITKVTLKSEYPISECETLSLNFFQLWLAADLYIQVSFQLLCLFNWTLLGRESLFDNKGIFPGKFLGPTDVFFPNMGCGEEVGEEKGCCQGGAARRWGLAEVALPSLSPGLHVLQAWLPQVLPSTATLCSFICTPSSSFFPLRPQPAPQLLREVLPNPQSDTKSWFLLVSQYLQLLFCVAAVYSSFAWCVSCFPSKM